MKSLDSRNERGTERILRLIDSLLRVQEALAIEDPRTRDKETLKDVPSLVEDIETSYEWLVGASRERARELLEILKPLLANFRVYKSITSSLRCIEKPIETLGEITKEESVELDRLYEGFRNSINSLADKNLSSVRSYLKATQINLLTSSLTNELVGEMLERYYLPELIKRMGYQLKSRVVSTSIGEVQVDVRGEKDEITGFENLERHWKRRVLIVEIKTTVKSEDIRSYSRKYRAILDNYGKESEVWKYKLTSEVARARCEG